MRFVMVAEPAPVPSLLQLLPPFSVPQSPAVATPAMTMSEHGFADTNPTLPHSEAMFARLLVTFVQAAAGASTFGIGSEHLKDSAPPAPAAPEAPPLLAPPDPAEPAEPPAPFPPAPEPPAPLPPAPV